MIGKIIPFFLTAILISCGPNKIKEETKNIEAPENGIWISTSTDAFINKVLGSGGTIRGFSLGDSISKIKTYENLEQFEETAEHIGYTFSTTDGEVVDVLYMYDSSNTLSEVQLDVYLNSDSISNAVSEALGLYFTQKYGKPLLDIGQPTWEIADSQKVVIMNIATKLDRGLQVNFMKD